MSCFRRKKELDSRPEQKWDFITLSDFKSRGCITPFAYGYLWFLLFLSIAFYAVDTFTAINLLTLNTWTSKIQPKVDINISKWIFCGCVIASYVNLIYEQLRAWRVMRRGNVTECYLDSLAARLECIRVGKGQGFRRFLVFAELTTSKKGAEYIALFTYFNFQSWFRVIVCSGPRQVLNAFTVLAFLQSDLNPGTKDVGGSFVGFFEKFRQLGEEDYQKAVILGGMMFTLIVWAFSLLYLILSFLFYVFFLCHWIPKSDGGLRGYCERKVTKALMKIVSEKVERALSKEDAVQLKLNNSSNQSTSGNSEFTLERKATLPMIADMETGYNNNYTATLPALSEDPSDQSYLSSASQRQPASSVRGERRLSARIGLTRKDTSSSTYSSSASLVRNASDMPVGGHQQVRPGQPPGYPTNNTQGSFDAMDTSFSSMHSYATNPAIQQRMMSPAPPTNYRGIEGRGPQPAASPAPIGYAAYGQPQDGSTNNYYASHEQKTYQQDWHF